MIELAVGEPITIGNVGELLWIRYRWPFVRKTFQLLAFSNLQVDLLDVRVTKIELKRGEGKSEKRGKEEKNSTSIDSSRSGFTWIRMRLSLFSQVLLIGLEIITRRVVTSIGHVRRRERCYSRPWCNAPCISRTHDSPPRPWWTLTRRGGVLESVSSDATWCRIVQLSWLDRPTDSPRYLSFVTSLSLPLFLSIPSPLENFHSTRFHCLSISHVIPSVV